MIRIVVLRETILLYLSVLKLAIMLFRWFQSVNQVRNIQYKLAYIINHEYKSYIINIWWSI